MTLPEVLRRVVSILNEESVAYMVTGSFATAYYAHPRATQDIDLVVEPAEDALERVAARLKEAGFYAGAASGPRSTQQFPTPSPRFGPLHRSQAPLPTPRDHP